MHVCVYIISLNPFWPEGAFQLTWSFHTTPRVEGHSIHYHQRILCSPTFMWKPSYLVMEILAAKSFHFNKNLKRFNSHKLFDVPKLE